MNTIEVYFKSTGNTIVGNYSAYMPLRLAMEKKAVFVPDGFAIKCELPDLHRLIEHIQIFGNCIKTLAGFKKACELSGVELVAE